MQQLLSKYSTIILLYFYIYYIYFIQTCQLTNYLPNFAKLAN